MSTTTITLRAAPTDEPCGQCDGNGEAVVYLGLSDDCALMECVWCHGTGRKLRPIPVVASLAMLRRDDEAGP